MLKLLHQKSKFNHNLHHKLHRFNKKDKCLNRKRGFIANKIYNLGFYKNLNEFELGHLLYDKNLCTPLYYACWFGYIEIVEMLLDCAAESTRRSRLSSSVSCSNFTEPNEDESYDDVFSSQESDCESRQPMDKESVEIRFEDSSLAISILYKRFECVKLLITRSTKYSFFRAKKNSEASSPKLRANANNSTELDCWFAASMKLNDLSEFMNMRNIFHELVLNGCKFSNYVFNLVDSMNELKQFKFDYQNNESNNLKTMPPFGYNSYMSNFLKSLAFVCNYNLEKLFNNANQCELFLKTIFLKINELFLSNEQL